MKKNLIVPFQQVNDERNKLSHDDIEQMINLAREIRVTYWNIKVPKKSKNLSLKISLTNRLIQVQRIQLY